MYRNEAPTQDFDYSESWIKDIGLASWGRKEIDLAQVEMPGNHKSS